MSQENAIRMWKSRKVPGNPKVGMTVASYLAEDSRQEQALWCLLHSVLAQTYQNFEVAVIHDGPLPRGDIRSQTVWRDLKYMYEKDQRLRWYETMERKAKFGHPWRSEGFELLRHCDYLCTTNQDNYYCPVFFEYVISEMVAKKADFAYCDCVHSHRQWKFMDTKLKRGHIDLGCWIAEAELVLNTPWDDFSFAGDWAYIQKLQKSAKKIIKVPAALFVHN